MSDIAIRVENISKCYRLGQRESYQTLRDSLTKVVSLPFRGLSSLVQPPSSNGHNGETTKGGWIWALKDVSFEIQAGEVLGIIGRNGTGKSTLLKILSGITEPTEGYGEIHGRVGSLLEVGTGFHPELTGRENIYLNGAILGMKRVEIARKFDEIVAFAEVEKFIDTPVKRYSSGMHMRLAFAVAAHLEPEILLVDEVLAVGDAAFQKKCLGKMGDVADEGRTVLFVSHNMGVIQLLCSRAILLRHGTVLIDSEAATAVATYLKTLEEMASQNLLVRTERRGKGQIRLAQIEVSTDGSDSSGILVTGRPAYFVFHTSSVYSGMSCSFTIYDQLGQPVTYFDSAQHGQEDRVDPEKRAKFLCKIDELSLLPGRYRINAGIMHNGELQDHLEAAAFFEVEEGKFQGRPVPEQAGYGSVYIQHRWVTPR